MAFNTLPLGTLFNYELYMLNSIYNVAPNAFTLSIPSLIIAPAFA